MNKSCISSRYANLLKAIDFFTQRFTLTQLSDFGFEFIKDFLELNSAALFAKENGDFYLKKIHGINIDDYTIINSKRLQNIATFHGNIMISNFETFFDIKDISVFNTNLVVPLIIDDSLFGFLLCNSCTQIAFEDETYNICNSLMRLINSNLENIKHMYDLERNNKQLDSKIFNLFAINHSSKSLLSELNLDKLYYMATDIFSEVTTSKVTSFGIYDNLTNTINVLGYRNVSNFSRYFTHLDLYCNSYNKGKIVLDMSKDIEIIKSIFVNYEEFYKLETKYIVLLVKDAILGFVTLSGSVTNSEYDESVFELIESLASFAYISLSNAILFQEIKSQKDLIEKKFKNLSKLNNIIKNINECASIEELCSLTLKTLHISFGIKQGFIALKDGDNYKITNSVGLSINNTILNINNNWQATFLGETIYEFTKRDFDAYFNQELSSSFTDSNCLVISPICVDNTYSFEKASPLAYVVILQTKNSLQEEELLLINTITQNISPILRQMNILKEMRRGYIKDTKNDFLNDITLKLLERDLYAVDFNLYYMKINSSPFKTFDMKSLNALNPYVFNNFVFVISYDDLLFPKLTKMENISSLEDIINYDY